MVKRRIENTMVAQYVNLQPPPLSSEKTQLRSAEGNGGSETLTSFAGDGFIEKPEQLQEEVERTKEQLQELMTKNCDLLLTSSNVLGSIQRDEFLASEEERSRKLESLQMITGAQDDVAKVLALPSSIRSYYEAGRFGEAVDTTISAKEQLLLLRTRTPQGSEPLRTLQQQVERERMRCNAAVLRALESPTTYFADIVRYLGYLRRLDILDEKQLRKEMMKRRGVSVDCKKRTIEKQCLSSPTKGLRAAASLLATGVLEVVVQYRALFEALDDVSAVWLSEQISWFLSLLFAILKAGAIAQRADISDSSSSALSQAARQGGLTSAVQEAVTAGREVAATPATATTAAATTASATAAGAYTEAAIEEGEERGGGGIVRKSAAPGEGRGGQPCLIPLEQTHVCAVYRETHHAAANLSRVGGYFFAAAAPAFETYLQTIVDHLASAASHTFAEEMDMASASWCPGLLFCGPSEVMENAIAATASAASPAYQAEDSAPPAYQAGDSAAFQKRLTLLWYPPLCTFYNGLVSAVNAFLDFPLVDVLPSLFLSVVRALWSGAHVLKRSFQKENESGEEWSSERKKEFMLLCSAFSAQLLDLVAIHLRQLQTAPSDIEGNIRTLRGWLQAQGLVKAPSP